MKTETLPMTEAEFQRQVTDIAELYGWQWAHFRPAQTAHGWRTPVSGPLGQGWPDLVLVHPRRGVLIFAELKVRGAVTPSQVAVHNTLQSAAPIYVWRPADFDTILEVLR